MNKAGNNPRNRQVYEEASEWLVELRVGEMDAASRERLDTWFRESPHHIRAFMELSCVWDDGHDLHLDVGDGADALIARARATTNVVPLETVPSEVPEVSEDSPHLDGGLPVPTPRTRLYPRWLALAAAVVVACFAAGWLALWAYVNPTYATDTGEQRIVQLGDGSTLTLDSRSRVRVRFSDHERDVDLLEGQALFQVAKDPARPFVVRSDSTHVRAVGTQFDVYRKVSGTTVTVVEGRVAVSPAAADAIQVSAGDQVVVMPSKVMRPDHADVAAATAWTRRELVFESTPLAEVAQEFNRYNARQLIVSDASLSDFHVTGVFSSTDPASLLRFLRAQPGVHVEERGTEVRIFGQ